MFYKIISFIFLNTVFGVTLGCTISINRDISDPQPLILRPERTNGNDAFYLPNDGDRIILSENDIIDLACPRGNLILNHISTGSSNGQAICTSKGKFSINDQILHFSAITCTIAPFHTARYTGNSCLSQYREIEVGFKVRDQFLKQMNVCFDEHLQTTLYSHTNLTKTIEGLQIGYPRPKWIQDKFYDLNGLWLNNLYKRHKQRTTINNLLGLPSGSYKYVAQNSNFFLSRGHLAPKTDFIFGAQHRLTFHFINAAPQWQIFNGQNWYDLERDVRSFASENGLDLMVFTGTYGVTTLPHAITGEEIELYLFNNGNRRGIPVPRLFWKIIYEPITKAGIVFVGVNNPYVFNESADVICTDICSQYSWLSWQASNYTLGYSYCCSIPEFRKTVTTVPYLDVVQLLK